MNSFEEVRRHSRWFIGLGVALIVLGVMAISAAVVTTLISVLFFGWLLLIGGVLQGLHAFRVQRWSGLLLQLLIGVLNIIVGLLIVANPNVSALALTLLMASFFLVGGLFRIVAAAVENFPGWSWALFSGLINMLLGILIWVQWPASSYWVIGMFIGIDLIFTGWWFITLSQAARRLAGAG